jgi:hypothetical protein
VLALDEATPGLLEALTEDRASGLLGAGDDWPVVHPTTSSANAASGTAVSDPRPAPMHQ